MYVAEKFLGQKKQGGGVFFFPTEFGCGFAKKIPLQNPVKFPQESWSKFLVSKQFQGKTTGIRKSQFPVGIFFLWRRFL
jgi:hypothetical protein